MRVVDGGRIVQLAEERVVHQRDGGARRIPRASLLIGAHVSAAGGVDKTIERALSMRAEAMQLWVDPPMRFPRAPLPVELLSRLREALATNGLPAYVHAPYLINLGTRDRALRRRSVDMIARALEAARLGGLRGAVVHAGSHLGRGYEAVREDVIRGFREACERAGTCEGLLLENTAGSGGQMAATLEEAGDLLDGLAALGIGAGLCLDVQHAHAALADLSSFAGVATFAGRLRAVGLARRIGLVHANDSGAPSGSRRDRHANPGEGSIGVRGFRALARVPELANVPWILECPGAERKGPGRREIRRLREIVRGAR